MKNWDLLGLMSGSSLDGMDIAHCKFTTEGDGDEFRLVHWSIEAAVTYAYVNGMKQQLQNATNLSSFDLIDLDRKFGIYTAEIILDFCSRTGIKPDFAALHGHTIFHEPVRGFTLQIGHPGVTASKAEMTIIGDFRSSDIALGGQGAPFAPIVDQYCFSNYDMIFNLGGIVNLTVINNRRVEQAYDLGPCNQILNHFAQMLGQKYDDQGEIARQYEPAKELMATLNQWYYYHVKPPKSLSNQQVMADFLQLFPIKIEPSIAIASMTKHIAFKMAECINTLPAKAPKVLITGGGAHNSYLIDLIKAGCPNTEIIVPKAKLVDFKECLLMALMGLLRMNEQNNVLSVVTGAPSDHCAGAVYFHEKTKT